MSRISEDFEKYGGSYLISNNNYEDYVQDKSLIGRPDGQFMVPSNQMDDMILKYPNDPREWERQLGLYENSLGDANIHRVDVYNPHDYEPRLPTKELSGANDKFLDGGKTPGGQDECVTNQFPNPENNPQVGKISVVECQAANISSDQNQNQSLINSQNIASVGGGANAPNKSEFNPQDYVPPHTSNSTDTGMGTGIQ